MTIGDCYTPAMQITEQAEADEYFEALVQRSMKHFGKTREEAGAIEADNLGYFAGYYSNETRLRVERLFRCVHPIFGSAEHPPTAEEAFTMGQEVAQKARTR